MTAECCSGLHSMDFIGSPDSEEEEVQLSHDELRQRIINTVRRGWGMTSRQMVKCLHN